MADGFIKLAPSLPANIQLMFDAAYTGWEKERGVLVTIVILFFSLSQVNTFPNSSFDFEKLKENT